MTTTEGEPTPVNRLARESSPYLLQHARNPVDWHPWGASAIELARREDRPIFLSIGYSTCYWCHVMERESFEDPRMAEILNGHFVSIKVDREQRPDVDELYMSACQIFSRLTTGHASGGWPLSVFIDPHTLKPYFVGTYFPPKGAHGRPGFDRVCTAMSEAWRERREEVNAQSERIAELVAETLRSGEDRRPLGRGQVVEAVDRLMSMQDAVHGGFGGAPKFPQPVHAELLLAAETGSDAVIEAVDRMLDHMAMGGIFDQLGGGFHRYAVDERWLVPHFEKMLYDNGQLAVLYAGSVERTGNPFHARVLRLTLDYVLREMTDPATGAFYSAQDAEVDGREGLNYLWTPEEVTRALESAGLSADLAPALDCLGLDLGPNFTDPHHRDAAPANVLHLPEPPDELARRHGLDPGGLFALLDRVAGVLLAERMARKQPALDDKVITAWNGLMIEGLAEGGRVLGDARYIEAARRAAAHLLETMRDDDGGLLRIARAGVASIPAFLEDHAMLGRGLVALHDATGERVWIEEAERLVADARERFWGDDGAWYDTLPGQPDLFVRSRNLSDGAVPSGIGTMLLLLQALAARTGDARHLDDLETALGRLSGSFASNPLASARAMVAVARAARDHPERLPGREPVADLPVTFELDPPRFDRGRLHGTLRVRIADGHHVNAHDPGDAALTGLSVRLEGVEGLDPVVSHPEGALYRESIRVHARTVEVPFSLNAPTRVTRPDRPRVVIDWQACSDQACLPPETTVLSLELPEREDPA